MSPKHCTACNKQGICADSRQTSLHVTRRYHCPICEARWSTYETRKDRWDQLKEQLRLARDRFMAAETFEVKLKQLFKELIS